MGGMVGGATVSIIIRAVDQFSSEFTKAQTSLGLLKKGFQVSAVGITGSFALMGKEAASFERTKISFEVMLGSAVKAQKMLNDLAVFSRVTPFTLKDLEENSRLLLGMGIEAENILPTIKALGDVSAGLNVPFERLALNFGQVKAQGRLLGTELRDFARAGVPIISELAKNLNVSEASIKELGTAGKISFEDVAEAFRTMTSEGGTFADLMSRSMDTTTGKISNLQDSIEKMSRSLGAVLLPAVNSVVDVFGGLIERFNSLDEAKKKLISTGVVTAGAGIAATGIGLTVYDLLKGSQLFPMRTFETNPAAMGGGISGVAAKGAGVAGTALAVTASLGPLLPTIAVPLVAQLLAKKLEELTTKPLEGFDLKTQKGISEFIESKGGAIGTAKVLELIDLTGGAIDSLTDTTLSYNENVNQISESEISLQSIRNEAINVADGLNAIEVERISKLVDEGILTNEQISATTELIENNKKLSEARVSLSLEDNKNSESALLLKLQIKELSNNMIVGYQTISQSIEGEVSLNEARKATIDITDGLSAVEIAKLGLMQEEGDMSIRELGIASRLIDTNSQLQQAQLALSLEQNKTSASAVLLKFQIAQLTQQMISDYNDLQTKKSTVYRSSATGGIKLESELMKSNTVRLANGKWVVEGSSDDNGTRWSSKAMASGGIVTKPTRALIGEEGPEAVIPLNSQNFSSIATSKFFRPENQTEVKNEQVFKNFITNELKPTYDFTIKDTLQNLKFPDGRESKKVYEINIYGNNIYGTDPDDIAEALQMRLTQMVAQ